MYPSYRIKLYNSIFEDKVLSQPDLGLKPGCVTLGKWFNHSELQIPHHADGRTVEDYVA